MSARTCQLCGKALSRIWVGAGEDFCSREHRNQFRLRRGMDRLHEANKVANLMRRREIPKPIAPSRQEGKLAVRVPETQMMRFAPRANGRIFPASKWAPPSRVPGARGIVPTYRFPPVEPKSRAFEILRNVAHQPVLSKKQRTVDIPITTYLNRTSVPQPLKIHGRSGASLRVSAGAGFRPPALQRPLLRVFPLPVTSLQWPDRLPMGTLASISRPAASRVFQLGFPSHEPLNPSLPGTRTAAHLNFPEWLAYADHQAIAPVPPEPFAWSALWSVGEIAMPRPIRPSEKGTGAARFVALPQHAVSGHLSQRTALVPLMPQDPPLGGIS